MKFSEIAYENSTEFPWQIASLLHNKRQLHGEGVVTLNQIERKLPITANADARDFNDLACCSFDQICWFHLI
jgi:hypothetical protein